MKRREREINKTQEKPVTSNMITHHWLIHSPPLISNQQLLVKSPSLNTEHEFYDMEYPFVWFCQLSKLCYPPDSCAAPLWQSMGNWNVPDSE